MKTKLHPDDILAVAVFVIMLSVTFINVVSRYVFHFGFSFSEELVTHLAVLLSGLGASQAVRNESHYDIPLLDGLVSRKTSRAFKLFSALLTMVFCLYMTYMGVVMVSQQFKLHKLSAAMRIPEWIYGLAIPIGCGFMGYYAVIVFVRTLRKKEKTAMGSEDAKEKAAMGSEDAKEKAATGSEDAKGKEV